MSTDQRKMLGAAAKACGLSEVERTPYGFFRCIGVHEDGTRCLVEWNPITNPADTAEMCAKLHIDWLNLKTSVICGIDGTGQGVEAAIKDHDNSRLKAWMYAATMVAAKIGGYEDAHP